LVAQGYCLLWNYKMCQYTLYHFTRDTDFLI